MPFYPDEANFISLLLKASRSMLGNYRLKCLDEQSKARKQMHALLDQAIEWGKRADLTEFFDKHGEEIIAELTSPQRPQPAKIISQPFKLPKKA